MVDVGKLGATTLLLQTSAVFAFFTLSEGNQLLFAWIWPVFRGRVQERKRFRSVAMGKSVLRMFREGAPAEGFDQFVARVVGLREEKIRLHLTTIHYNGNDRG